MRVDELIAQFGTILATTKSDTTEELYEIRWNREGGYHCTCQGYRSSKHKVKTCKHIKRFCFKYQVEQELLKPNFPLSNVEDLTERILKIAITNWDGII